MSPDVVGALKYLKDAYPCLGEQCKTDACKCIDWDDPWEPSDDDAKWYYQECKGWNLNEYLTRDRIASESSKKCSVNRVSTASPRSRRPGEEDKSPPQGER